MSEFIRLQANGVDAYPDASTENTYRSNGTSVESALLALESNVNTLGGVAGEAKTLAEQNSVKIATAEQEISDINSSLTLDYSQSNLPTDTNLNDFLQLVCNQLFPKTYWSYKDGEEFDSYNKASGSGSLVKESNRLKISTSASANGAYTLVSSSLMDFTNFRKLYIEFSSTKNMNNYVSFGYGTSASASYSGGLQVTDGNSKEYNYEQAQPKIAEFDISNVDGNRSVFILGQTGSQAASTVYVTKVYLG